MGLAGTGCRRPEQNILPFSKMPEDYVHGVPQYYATAMPTRGEAIPLVVKSNDGRPTKVEGNACTRTATAGRTVAQASILNLYDPDRAMQFQEGGQRGDAGSGAGFPGRAFAGKLAANGGQGLAFLLERSNSPSRARLQKLICAEACPRPSGSSMSRWTSTSIAGRPRWRSASRSSPYFRCDQAKVIVSLDCDFLGAEEDVHNNIRRFAQGRKLEKPDDAMNRLYVVESLMTLTGCQRGSSAAGAAERGGAGGGGAWRRRSSQAAATRADRLGSRRAWIRSGFPSARRIWLAHRGESLVVAGHRQPLAVHLLAHAMNAALGNIGKTVVLLRSAGAQQESTRRTGAGA